MADGTRAERTDAWANRPVPAFPSVRRLRAGFAGGGLFGNAVSTMLSSVFVLLVNMATGVLTARLLGPDGRGLQAALVLWPQFLAFTTTLGLHSALLYYMKKDPERESALYAAGMLMSLLTGTGAVAIGALIIPPRLSGYPEWAAAAAVGLTGVVPFIHLVFLSNASLRAREQFRLFNRTRWLIPVMTLAMLLALAASGRLTPLTAAIAYQAAYVPVAVWAVVREIPAFRRMLRNGTASVREAAGRLVRYGTRSYGADLLGNLILYMDQLFLVGLLAPEALGLYTVAVSLSRMLNVFSTSLVAVLFPEASGLPENEAATLSLRVFKISMLAGLAAALALSALAPPALRLLYGAAFMEAIPVFRLLVLEVVAGGAAMVLAQAFMAAGRPGIVSLSHGLGLAVLVPLLLTLVPRHGLIGAGWSLLASAGLRLAYVLIRFHILYRPGFRALWPGRDDLAWATEVLRGHRPQAKEKRRTAECETMRQTAASIPPAALAPPEPKAPSGAPVPSEPLAMPAAFRVAAFREKPDRQEASRLIRLGALWNCGVFAFRLRFMLDLLEANGWPLQYEALVRRYAGLAKTSFDRAVVEKAANIVAVRYDGKWKDLGTWPALAAELSDRVIGMGLLAERSDGTHLVNELEIPVAVLGIPDAIVAAGPDGVMVANKAVSHKIKEIAGWFDRRPMLEEHRWGESRIMDRFRDGDGCETIVRRLSLKDGARIGNRVHLRRRGLWVVLAGEGEAVIGGRLKRVSAGDALPIPPGKSHGIRALQGLVLLEIQRGANLDDSDAVHESGDRRDAAAGGLRRSETD